MYRSMKMRNSSNDEKCMWNGNDYQVRKYSDNEEKETRQYDG